jgi:hypothetical protein
VLHPTANLSLNDAGNENGTNFRPHQAHDLGRAVDVSYVDDNGNPLHLGNASVWRADDDVMRDMVERISRKRV